MTSFCDSEIRDGGGPRCEEDVAGLDISVDDAVGVRECQRSRDVAKHCDSIAG
jgi:hypothetical protein